MRITLLAFGIAAMAMMASAADRVFELRTYTTYEGKLDALKARFRDHTIAIFNRHGMTSIGYWVPADPEKSKNTLIYIIAHPSMDEAKKHWDEFRNDPEWKKVSADSEKDGKIVSHVDSVFMTPADFSMLK
jgi:NIPSNAP